MSALNLTNKILSVVIILLTLGLGLISASPSESDDDSGRVTPPTAAVAAVDPTPGQQARRMQTTLLTEENILSVLGEASRTRLTNLGIDWSVFTDLTKEYNDPAIRHQMHRIKGVLDKERPDTDAFYKFYFDFNHLFNTSKSVAQDRIEDRTVEYFSALHRPLQVRCLIKGSGVHMGTVALVHDDANETRYKYYVKTHSGGLLSERSSAAKPFDLAELLTYRVLHGLGFGCEAHFFGRDQKDFYIATLDASSDGQFREYDKVRETPASMSSTCGVLSECDIDYKPSEEEIMADTIARNFITQVVTLDLLARILRLEDLQSNGGNFGFVKDSPDSFDRLMVIDFRLLDGSRREFNEMYWGGFLEGNGLFKVSQVDQTVRYVLHDRDIELRVQTAKHVFEEFLSGYERVCDEACASVVADLRGEDYAQIRQDLPKYTQVLKNNFLAFKTFCDNHQPGDK